MNEDVGKKKELKGEPSINSNVLGNRSRRGNRSLGRGEIIQNVVVVALDGFVVFKGAAASCRKICNNSQSSASLLIRIVSDLD